MKRWLIAAAVLLTAGLILILVVLAKFGFDFSKLGVGKKETKTVEITETFDRVSVDVDTSDVTLLPSEDGSCRAVCVQSDKVTHSVAVENGVLVVRQTDDRSWAEKVFTWDFIHKSVTVYLPAKQYEAVTAQIDTGDLRIESLSADEVNVTGSTGDVRVTDLTCRSLAVKRSTGDVDLIRTAAETVDVKASTGDVRLEGCGGEICRELTVRTSTGRITLADTVIPGDAALQASTGKVRIENSEAGTLRVETSTGDVTFLAADAGELRVKTSTGDVEGSLRTGKIFQVQTDTGDVSVPESTTGGLCKIETDTGDVKLRTEP